ncbi:phospholipid-transporting ATPase ABCA3-like [Amblyomma americanum]
MEDLTCIQNMLYFGSLKGGRSQELTESIKNTLSVVKLEDKAHCRPKELSGGMKRRLSIAITLVSKPDLLILDEPTTGMDPETRRTVWDVMKDVAKERTILLSSHDMDEADAIGDHVIIMSGGKVVCSGSTAFLKRACGVGYKLTLVKVPNVFNLNGVNALVRETAPTAEVDEDKQQETVITLHTLDHKNFPQMFEVLEGSADRLGIAKMGVTVASMKDVYLKINMDWAPGGKQRDQPVDESDIAAVCRPISKERTLRRCFYALWAKRLIYLARSWGLLLSGFALPLLLLLLVVITLPTPSVKIDEVEVGATLPMQLRLATHFPEATIIVQEAPAAKDVSAALRVLVESQGCSVRIVDNVTEALRNEYLADFGHYIRTLPFAIGFETDAVRLIVNPTRPVALPLAINFVDAAELRAGTAQPLARIDAAITYVKLPSGDALLYGSLATMWGTVYWPLLPALSYALVFACFAAFPVAERLGGARDVQLMTGISGAFFIVTHALFDMLHYAIVMGHWCLLHYVFSDYELKTAGYMALSFTCFAPSVIGLAYLVAEVAVSPGKAMANTVLVVYAGGIMSIASFEAVHATLDIDGLRYLFSLFPPYAMLRCLEKITRIDMNADLCRRSKVVEAEMSAGLSKGTSGSRDDGDEGFCNFTPPLALGPDSIGTELLCMVGVGLAMLAAMSFLISGYLFPATSFTPQESKLDDDVEEHRKLVNKLKENGDFGEQALVAWRLHKRYDALHVVKGVSLALRPSECFGLLGVNGAGKTTTFQMLAKLTSASYGDAYTTKARLSGNTRQWQSQISYCFQLGGLLDRLNAYEYLYLVGRLRGISDADLRLMVDSLLSVVDLKEHARKECGVYSGGNRRKLSIGAALLGLSPLVFLDEPYAGVDVVSRNKIFRAIAAIQKLSSTAFVLTSHNMEECEFSCDRLTIMAAGEMMCLGTLQHLREKFGQGFRLELALRHDRASAADAQRVTLAVQQQFPGATVTEEHENVRGYHLTERMPWSELFRRLCRLEEELGLQHAIVGENTLEQIFLQFAKEQEKGALGNAPQQQLVTAVPSRPEAAAAPGPAAPAVAS